MSELQSPPSQTPSEQPLSPGLPAAVIPPLHTNERIVSSWDHICLSVRGCDNLQFGSNVTFLGTTGARSGIFQSNVSAHGRLYLTSSRLVFIIIPAPPFPQNGTAAVSFAPVVFPLAWLPATESVHAHHPFFDVPHVSISFHPLLEHTLTSHEAHIPSLPDPIPRRDFATVLLYPLHLDAVSELQTAITTLVADRAALASNTRALRQAIREHRRDSLIPTQEHFAFVDPDNPDLLHLATQMTYSLPN